VKSGSLLVRSCNLVAAISFFFVLAANSQTKRIRLRNETIVTGPKTTQSPVAQISANATQVSGLFLIQFDTALSPVERAQLRSAGVELLKYVPEDAFIARFKQASLGQVQGLPFVRWVGTYRSAHKIHPRLVSAARTAAPAAQLLTITALLSPAATAAEVTATPLDFQRART